MKKVLLLLSFIVFSFSKNTKAQCAFTDLQSFGTIYLFEYNWVLPMIYTLDSVALDYGDGFVEIISAAQIQANGPVSIYPYTNPGTYNVCITQYLSFAGGGPVLPNCVSCTTINVMPPPPCFGTPLFSSTTSGLTANFTDLSSCPTCLFTDWTWDFGDGSSPSLSQNPTHTYAAPGTYYVCLETYFEDATGNSCSETYCDSVTVSSSPVLCFANANFSSTTSGLLANFSNLSTCTNCVNSSYAWNFGGQGTSAQTNPSFTFSAPGTYNVCLVLTGQNSAGITCIDTFCQNVTVSQITNCIANANFGQSGSFLTKSFLNTSNCSNCVNIQTTWYWTFGDGGTSTLMSPTHTYATGGTYNVCLVMNTANSAGITCTDTTCQTITVLAPGCYATAGFTNTVAGNTATFTNTSTCASCATQSYIWDFGDATSSTLASPAHTYATAGVYTVCLIINGTYGTGGLTCSDTICSTVNIFPASGCLANSTFTFTTNGLQANFTSNSTCLSCTNPTYSWNFGDGSLPATSPNPVHTYSGPGTYNVCLIFTGTSSSGGTCKDTFCTSVTVVIPVLCSANAAFSTTNVANTVNCVNLSTCNNCTSTIYSWTFGDGGTSSWNSPSHTYTSNGTYNICLKVIGYANNQSICVDSICKQINVTSVGIEDIAKRTLNLYPNPASQKVHIELPSHEPLLDLKVFDVTGRRVLYLPIKGFTNNTLDLDISQYTNGLYIIQVNTNTSHYRAQVLKQ